jgi:DNA-binding GntR family transcriptional regulator
MPRPMALISDLHPSDARFLFATWKQLDWQRRSATEHRAILDAITRRDGDGARALLETHVREAGRALLERLRNTARTEADAARTLHVDSTKTTTGEDAKEKRKP